MQDLTGRTAVVTGAASGIGLALAQRFAAEGMQLVLCDVNGDDLGLHSKELGERGADVLAVRSDTTDPTAMDALADAALERFGTVDVLCPNAGIVGPLAGATWEIPLEDWQRVFDVNVFGVANTLRSFVPHMLASGREGHVVFTASIRGLMVGNGAPTYQGSKHAVLSLAEVLRTHLREREANVGVSAILAGPVFTKMAPNEMAYMRRVGREPVLPNRDRAGAGAMAPLQPEDIADRAVAAIRENRFYVFTHENSKQGVMDWFGPIIEALDS